MFILSSESELNVPVLGSPRSLYIISVLRNIGISVAVIGSPRSATAFIISDLRNIGISGVRLIVQLTKERRP
jgi:hypothetical protein